jgi:hypothetical protein
MLLLAGCRVDSTVNVSLSRDGGADLSVVVTVDQEVAERLAADAGEPRLDGLVAAGWITTSADQADGSRTFTSTARCATPASCVTHLDALGVFRGLTIGVKPGRFEDEISFDAVIDLSNGLAAFGLDTAVVTDEALTRTYGVTAAQATTFTVALEAPDGFDVVAPGASVNGQKATWQTTLGSEVPMSFEARESASQTWLVARIATGLATAGILLLLFVLVRGWRRRRTNRRRPSRAIDFDELDDDFDDNHNDDHDGGDVAGVVSNDDDDLADEIHDDEPPYRAPKHAR